MQVIWKSKVHTVTLSWRLKTLASTNIKKLIALGLLVLIGNALQTLDMQCI